MSAPADDPRVLLDTTVACPACDAELAIPGGGYVSEESYLEAGFAVAREHAAGRDDDAHRDLVAQLEEAP